MNSFTHILIASVSSGLGLLVLVWIPYGIRKAGKIQHWPSVPGRITESGVVMSSGSGNSVRVWEPKISYSYVVDGQEYTGHNIFIVETDSSFKQSAEDKIAPYPVGREITVFYNPQDPEDTVLERQWSIGDFILPAVIGIVFLAVGIYLWSGGFDH